MRTQTFATLAVLISISGAATIHQASAQIADGSSERSANQAASTLSQALTEQAGLPGRQATAAVGTPVLGHNPNGSACTNDQLVHAEVSPAITSRIKKAIAPLQKGIQVRDIAMLALPCGFKIDERSGWNLLLTNGSEVRRYVENNSFGFAPAFGFGDAVGKSYTMRYEDVEKDKIQKDGCPDGVASADGKVYICSGFGNEKAFFGVEYGKDKSHLGHYAVQNGAVVEDFLLADVNARVESIFFLPLPDASGGTITLIVNDGRNWYRAYVDTPRG